MYISVHHTYTDSYGISHSGLSRSMLWDEIENEVTNSDEIRDRDSVTNIVIDTDLKLIAQAGGWSENRGLFVDMYGLDGKLVNGRH